MSENREAEVKRHNEDVNKMADGVVALGVGILVDRGIHQIKEEHPELIEECRKKRITDCFKFLELRGF